MVGTERRRHVRLKPTPELPARVALVGDGLLRESLDLIDISVGGLLLSSSALTTVVPGQRMKLLLTLGVRDEYAIEVVARWTSGESVGAELVDPAPSTAQAVSRYISELLERGGSP